MAGLRNWWQSKTMAKRDNWLMLGILVMFIVSGFIEAGQWLAMLGVIPVFGMIYLECTP